MDGRQADARPPGRASNPRAPAIRLAKADMDATGMARAVATAA